MGLFPSQLFHMLQRSLHLLPERSSGLRSWCTNMPHSGASGGDSRGDGIVGCKGSRRREVFVTFTEIKPPQKHPRIEARRGVNLTSLCVRRGYVCSWCLIVLEAVTLRIMCGFLIGITIVRCYVGNAHNATQRVCEIRTGWERLWHSIYWIHLQFGTESQDYDSFEYGCIARMKSMPSGLA
jgi:hypothetical protein